MKEPVRDFAKNGSGRQGESPSAPADPVDPAPVSASAASRCRRADSRRYTAREEEAFSNRLIAQLGLVLFDFFATFVAFIAAAWGTETWALVTGDVGTLACIAFLAVVNIAVFFALKLYQSIWRYAGIFEAVRIFLATVVGSAVGDVLLTVLTGGLSFREYLLAWAILLILCAGLRLTLRAVSSTRGKRFALKEGGALPRTLVVGAGEAGALTIARMLQGDRDMMGEPVAIADDSPAKLNQYIHGVKVAGSCEDIPALARKLHAEQIVFAIPSAGPDERREIYDLCMQTGLRVLTLPNVRDIPTDQIGRMELREVEIGDLLSRDEVILDAGSLGYVEGACVLVTGGGGSIGSEIVRQLVSARPAKVVVFDIYENTAYELFHEISGVAAEAGTEICVEIGSITSEEALRDCFEKHAPRVVFHAAAHKHVPLMENNAREAVANNVFGTQKVARLADEFGCSHFILISTDKAVNPVNVMGATKRMCEMDIQYFAQTSRTVFAAVRFGNVLGSHGSVIPLFKRQLRAGGPITLTHPDITRYFMTIPEAARLVITAGALAKGGEIFILKMGEPVRIMDLAENLIRLSGLTPGRDVEIKITGLRPGEKLFEELQMDDEEPVATSCDDIMVSAGKPLPAADIAARLESLQAALDGTNNEVKAALAAAVPTYTPRFDA